MGWGGSSRRLGMIGEGIGWGEGRPRRGGQWVGGTGGRGAHEGRPCGGRGVRWAVGMAHSNGMEGRWRPYGATRLFAGPRNGTWGRGGKMGPRMREDKGGVFTPILTFPPQGGREGEGGRPRGTPLRGKGEGGGRGMGGVSGRRRSLWALRLRLGGWCRR